MADMGMKTENMSHDGMYICKKNKILNIFRKGIKVEVANCDCKVLLVQHPPM